MNNLPVKITTGDLLLYSKVSGCYLSFCQVNRFLPREQRVVFHQGIDLFAYLGDIVRIFGFVQDSVDEIDDLIHLCLFQSTGRDGRGTHTDTGGLERGARVEGHHIFVGRNIGLY